MSWKTKILVVSDIHGDLSTLSAIVSVEMPDYIISCGDNLLPKSFMQEMFSYYVDGNNDELDEEFYSRIPSARFEIDGLCFYVEHGHNLGNYELLRDPKKVYLDFDTLAIKTY
ncbi:metallophosphoesterase family protein [Mycoplasmopsis caviae]|uniref:Phosphoesterase n=1 Tax=Mycoplasmopsis caviae TaxID=55603 RepID=A0A3P8L6V3_9BACT|nr:metallophosphoesterase family protein [Mycoplasmopsis caviae]UUD35448.1 metallophosphoesterase family protein [Mycoplasmopsis caviae]VDR41775.1 phosphoesterase [Mycoplasmopsis caviae]